jgi:hypothetical protein
MLIYKLPLADKWRAEAARLDVYEKALRRDGYTAEADDAQQAATDYRIAADELEALEA